MSKTSSYRSSSGFCVFICTLSLWLFSGRALAAQEALQLCFNQWPPFAMYEQMAFRGISIDIIKEASRRLEQPVEFVELPWKRCLQNVEDGTMDAVIDAADRDEFIQGPVSISIYSDTFWVHADSSFRSLTDLKDRSIGLVDGYNYSQTVTDLISELNLSSETAVDDQGNIRKIAFKRVDTGIADLVSTFDYIKIHQLNLRPILPPVSVDKLYLSFSKQRAEAQEKYNQQFEVLLEEGFVDKVYQRYIGQSFSELLQDQ
ncbi:MAG: transporter substrate-binding domain-containing protein [Gammaproteobacteria bacterium]|nr:transporter substrate-binding domain-containing protein [Gammaproteobacteria bacterium]